MTAGEAVNRRESDYRFTIQAKLPYLIKHRQSLSDMSFVLRFSFPSTVCAAKKTYQKEKALNKNRYAYNQRIKDMSFVLRIHLLSIPAAG